MERTKTHESLYASSLIEASLDPLIVISPGGKIADMNQAKTQITGFDREVLIGTNFYDYFTEPEKAREVYLAVFEKGSIKDIPLTFRHKHGQLTDVLFNGSVYRSATGVVVGAVVVARDISEQRWASELRIANKELAFQNEEKEKRAAELITANKELVFQNREKEKRADELVIANKELAFQNEEKEKRAAELFIANKELAFQNEEKGKRAAEFVIANKELAFQNKEKEKRAAELVIANKELTRQNQIKEKRAAELVIANKELLFQTDEKANRAAELVIADIELVYQNKEKEKRAAELAIADIELAYQNKEKEKREVANKKLETLRYAAEKSSQYARSLLEASLDPLFTINLNGKITDLNNASANITGVSREDLIGTDFFDYFTQPDKAREVYKEVFKKGFVADYPLTIRDQKLTDVLFNGSVYKDGNGKVLGVVVVARDITEQKRNASELNEAIVFAELATGIAEEAKENAEKATVNAERATITAENAVKAKQQFLSNMSHEIRTPMNAIIGFTKVLLKTDLAARQKEYLTAIKMSGDALIVLINDILDLAKVDSGKMTFQQTPFKLGLSLSAMLHLFEPKIQEKNLTLIKIYDDRIPEVLLGDPMRLHQIILNLVSNAVKFTSSGTITIIVNMLGDNDQEVIIEFSVSDTGIGIAPDKISKIFENFQQASSGTSRLYGGTGLGLAIVKQLVGAQGGTIGVKSTPQVGSTFSFVLHFMKTSGEVELEQELLALDTEIKNIKVLVVEDIALNQLLMKTLLDDFGFEGDIASNGKLAVDMLQKKSYDVILMDLHMPEMNGFEATEYIRNSMGITIPIIALTADVTTADLKKCKAVGMNDYLAKPVDERLLFSKIVGLVKTSSPIDYRRPEEFCVSENAINKCVDLEFLIHRTKANPQLMMEMITAYLEQTPPLILAMKQGLHDKDWDLLYSAVHKLIPSFSIMGIDTEFENIAKKVQEFASTRRQVDDIPDLVLKLEKVCNQACMELENEFKRIKGTTR